MGNYKSQRELVNSIASNIDQLESGQLSIFQLENHMNDVRELYERTVVLRYKIFENKSDVPTSTPVESSPKEIEIVIDAAEKSVLEVENKDEPPTIDFSLFEDNDGEESDIDPIIVEEKTVEEPVIETPSPIHEEEKIEVPVQLNSIEFNRRFSDIASQTAGQFGYSKLDTLVGAFGLNERLQYINELFDGSSDVFSEAVKSLDSMPSLDSVKAKAAQLADQNKWDLESDTVEEFIQKLCRRHA